MYALHLLLEEVKWSNAYPGVGGWTVLEVTEIKTDLSGIGNRPETGRPTFYHVGRLSATRGLTLTHTFTREGGIYRQVQTQTNHPLPVQLEDCLREALAGSLSWGQLDAVGAGELAAECVA